MITLKQVLQMDMATAIEYLIEHQHALELVPVEPTLPMLKAGNRVLGGIEEDRLRDDWQEMLEAWRQQNEVARC